MIFIKWGGSLITDKTKPLTPRPDVIRRLSRELKEIFETEPIVLGHGSGSFGHFAVKQSEGWKDRKLAGAYIHAVASRLNQLVIDILTEEKVPAIAFPPAALENEGYLWVKKLKEAADMGFLPVVYGDAIPRPDGFEIFSTEKVFELLNPILRPRTIIFVGEVAGVFTSDPKKDPDAQLIPEITPKSFEDIKSCIGGSHGIDVTGGMLQKVESAIAVLKSSPWVEKIYIISGDPGNMKKAAKGEVVGTCIHR